MNQLCMYDKVARDGETGREKVETSSQFNIIHIRWTIKPIVVMVIGRG